MLELRKTLIIRTPTLLRFLPLPIISPPRRRENGLPCFRTLQTSHSTTPLRQFDEMPQRNSSHSSPLDLLKTSTPIHGHAAGVHGSLLRTGILSDIHTRTSLIAAYGRAGLPDSSLALFRESPTRDVVLWNATLQACVQNQDFRAGLDLFREMVMASAEFDSVTFVILLSVMSRTRDLGQGHALHGSIVKRGLDLDVTVCNSLIDVYAKNGDYCSSISLFDAVEFKDIVSWNSVMTGCLSCGFPEKTALYFKNMRFNDLLMDHVGLSAVISACSCLEDLYEFGLSVHAVVTKFGCNECTSVGNSLISFYSWYGVVEASEKVFSKLNNKNVVSCNSMMSMFAENQRFEEVLDILYMMLFNLKIKADSVTVLTILSVCAELQLLAEGKIVHSFVVRNGFESMDVSVTNSLIDMYAKCDDLMNARILFNSMPSRDLISWNTMISGFSKNQSLKDEAQILFCALLRTGHRCSLATLLAVLPSCTSPDDHDFGKLVHSWMFKNGLCRHLPGINALMLMYISCENLEASLSLFDRSELFSDIISWNTIIVGCAQKGYFNDSLKLFYQMHNFSHSKQDPITLVSVLSACGSLILSAHGRAIHGLACKSLLESDIRVRNALISMYLRCSDIESSESVFRADAERNLCSWNCMISGLVQNNEAEKAFNYFHQMEDLQPNEITMVSLLCACTQLKSLKYGRQINGCIYRFGFYDNSFISAALVDMYSKCGRLDISFQVFKNLPEKSIASWNSMIFAYGNHGYGRKAIELFRDMCKLRIKATKSTFIGVLSACSHSALIDEGLESYNQMKLMFGIEPTTEHHVCLVDMLGRAGRINEAYKFIRNMNMKPAPSVWGALLSACKEHGNIEMGKSVAKHLFGLEPENEGYYVALANMYATTGMWDEAVVVRCMIQERGLVKPLGGSFIEVCTV